MSEYKNILVLGEITDGKITAVTKELLGGARKLADQTKENVHIVFVGDGVTSGAAEAILLGADIVYVIDNPDLKFYHTERYMGAVAEVIKKENPRLLLFAHGDMGADLGPRFAFRLNSAIVTDCIQINVDPENGQFIFTKPVYGGVAMAEYTTESLPQIATVRPKSLEPAEINELRRGECIALTMNFDVASSPVAVIEKVVQNVEGVKLEDAEIVVSGGRGIGDTEGFKVLEEAAKFFKGAVGASRVACDNGWMPTTVQVGITGKIVAPRVYIAVGISGASQHMSGCSRSKIIIAINKDAAAAIFKQAQYGVVGDWKVVLPAFINKLKTLE
jgi:electron transfer flavoprotein alpha subunit